MNDKDQLRVSISRSMERGSAPNPPQNSGCLVIILAGTLVLASSTGLLAAILGG